MHGVNLIPRARRQRKRVRRRLRLWVVSLLGCSLILLGLSAAASIILGHDKGTTAAELQQARRKVSDLQASLADVAHRFSAAQAEHQASSELLDQPDWSVLLSLLGSMCGDEVMLRRIAVAPPPSTSSTTRPARYDLTIAGFGSDQQAVSHFLVRLQQTNLFDQLRLARSGREPLLAGSVISFELTCSIAEQTGGAP